MPAGCLRNRYVSKFTLMIVLMRSRIVVLYSLTFTLVCLLTLPSLAQVVAEAPAIQSHLKGGQPGPLSAYVAQADDSFGYELAESGHEDNCDWLRYNLVSQTWQGIVWKHVVWLVLPKSMSNPEEFDVTGDSAILFIGGGSWKNDWAQRPSQSLGLPREFALLSTLAAKTQSPVVYIEQVPFQPILDGRFEDAIIAETFRRFMMGEGDTWPLLLPMVKSAVRCMDMVQEQLSNRFKLDIHRFTVSGASKRGWTTWLTSAIDSRVDALAPIVIDMLNMPTQMKHQLEIWGKYSDEIADYTDLKLQDALSTPRGEALQSIVDPYAYRDVIDQPKLLIFATNDRYWALDACNFYWDDLKGSKNLLYIPNNGHGIKDTDRLIGSLAAFHSVRKDKRTFPEINWAFQRSTDGSGQMTVTLDAKPTACSLWIARSDTKDFRSAEWISIPMAEQSSMRYTATIDSPKQENVAFFAEVQTDESLPAYLSTNMTILYHDAK
jgi:PhoPQ-activated pathogenicity-related protein